MASNFLKAAIARALTSAIKTLDSGGANAYPRAGSYGELMTQDMFGGRLYGIADEGSYFIAQQPDDDLATTVVGHAAPVIANLYTKPFLHMINNSASGVRAYLDFIEITVITAGANGTANYWAAETDTGATRYSSGTVKTLTISNPNMQVANTAPNSVVKCGPFVATAASAAQRKLGLDANKVLIEFTGDKYLFVFGSPASSIGAQIVGAASRMVTPMPTVVLGYTDQFLLHMFATAQDTAGVYKVRMGWWER